MPKIVEQMEKEAKAVAKTKTKVVTKADVKKTEKAVEDAALDAALTLHSTQIDSEAQQVAADTRNMAQQEKSMKQNPLAKLKLATELKAPAEEASHTPRPRFK